MVSLISGIKNQNKTYRQNKDLLIETDQRNGYQNGGGWRWMKRGGET